MESVEELERWFRIAGVNSLHACIGPLPETRAALVRWASDRPEHAIRSVGPHPGTYRLALMLEPLDARIWQGDKPFWGGTIGANRFRLCPPAEQGRWCQLSACDIVNLFLPVRLLDRLAQQRGEEASVSLAASPFTSDRTVFDLVRKMLDAQALAGPLASEMCDHLVSALACYLLEHYSLPSQAEASSLGGARLRRVLRHIADHLDSPLPNAGLAGLCGMSAAHFSREFHRAVGLPPHRYVLTRRLEQACNALSCGNARIADVAEAFGFHSASHFIRAFTAQYGLSPAAWRARRSNNS
ncbi:helix-turn-helix domain-containing protein [Pseudoduganella violaceinigra]|uniref:helix-turn-helix domain-containing protein n=1 Tax=Pseudoduganella violaceinigra TaxID=246602 RepID=UPI00055354B7|nr:AraC family transcriptional regulator [Pseudoduganella violaceinigra]